MSRIVRISGRTSSKEYRYVQNNEIFKLGQSGRM
jgi:hypothetical protein